MSIQEVTREKDRKLGEILRGMGRVLIAFSGGVDSTFVLKRAQQELGDQVLAVTAASETFPSREFNAAAQLAEQIGVPLHKTEIKELENANFVANNPDRCYHCKTGLYSHLQQLAKELGYPYILDGSNMDDRHWILRPGYYKPRTSKASVVLCKSPA